MSTCQNTTNYEYGVVVKIPKTLKERCRNCRTGLGRAFAPCMPCFKFCFIAFLVLLGFAVLLYWWLIIIVVGYCHLSPGLGLEGLVVRDMVVYQNATSAATSTWLVKSDIGFNLSTWNRNTVAGCYTTYRRMIVQAHFKDVLILRQEVPLGFLLKIRRSRPVSVDVHGDGYPMPTELGSLLQVELRNASAVELQFLFETRYLSNDRKAGWMRMRCDAIAKSPLGDSSVHANSDSIEGGLVWSSCKPA